jgi:hypothetical protein
MKAIHKANKAKNPKTYFCGKSAPSISIKEFLVHLAKHLKTPPAVMILMMIYVERLLQSLTNAINGSGSAYPYLLTSLNAHKIILVALLEAHKYSMDVAYPFKYISKMVGIPVSELRVLEYEFLFFIKYELYVSQDLYAKYEEVFKQWPALPEEEKEEELDEPHVIPAAVKRDNEPQKESEDPRDESSEVERLVDQVKLTDEQAAEIPSTRPMEQRYNPPDIIESPAVDRTTSSPMQSMEILNYIDGYDSEDNSHSKDEDTEMTIFDENDLGEDVFEEDVIIY